MNILLVANYPVDGQVSMQRFAQMLESGLRAAGMTVRLIAPQAVLFPGCKRTDRLWKWVGYVNKFVIFPWVLRRAARDSDLVHICDHSNSLYVAAVRARPHVVTCHDVIAIRAAKGHETGWRVRATGRLFQALILRGLRSAQRIACVSGLTREQLLEVAPELKGCSSVIENALNLPLRPVGRRACEPVLQTLGLPGTPYFLHVGSAQPRKNRAGLVRLFGELLRIRPRLPHRLVLAGAGLGPDVVPVIESLGLAERVVGLGYVSDDALPALYSGAEALIFPSLSEGFGWPVIEAQACGCAVFASKYRPMPDIGVDAAVYFDPNDPVSAARCIAEHLPSLETYRKRGLANARRFDVATMIERYLAVYREAMAEREALNAGRSVEGAGHA